MCCICASYGECLEDLRNMKLYKPEHITCSQLEYESTAKVVCKRLWEEGLISYVTLSSWNVNGYFFLSNNIIMNLIKEKIITEVIKPDTKNMYGYYFYKLSLENAWRIHTL